MSHRKRQIASGIVKQCTELKDVEPLVVIKCARSGKEVARRLRRHK